jgi:ABC-type transport system involved in multi-copper enzyme maturation permease subunit
MSTTGTQPGQRTAFRPQAEPGHHAPYQTQVRPGRDGFLQLMRAEWTKLRTVRGWVIGLLLAAVLTDLFGLLVVNVHTQCGSQSGAVCLPRVPTGPGGEAVNDSFYFVRQSLTGNGSITARLTSLTGEIESGTGGFVGPGQNAHPGLSGGLVPWAKAGIIIKASTRQGSAYAAMMATGSHGVRMQYDYTADVAGMTGTVSAASPRWLRLTRSGDTITGYDSADGLHWSEVGVAHLSGLAGPVQAGLFATSPVLFTPNLNTYAESGGGQSPSLATGVFTDVSLRGGRPGSRWAGTEVGAGDAPYSGPQIGFRQAGGTYRVTGSGDIGPVVSGGANTGFVTGTIGQHLLGIFFGLVILVVIAAMFMTVEYRRGLIRTTLAASPRRGRALAAKAAVIGLATFVLGTVTVAVAVTVGIGVSRHGGEYVLPVSLARELQVIVGTGAMLAVASVLALAIGAILRRSAAAVAAVIVIITGPYIFGVAGVLPAGVSEWVLRITPAAAFAIEQSVPQYHQVLGQYGPPDYYPLAPWAGFAVLCAYAAVALGFATYLLRRRDA